MIPGAQNQTLRHLLLAVLAGACALLLGCAAAEVQEVNKAAIANRPSYTDTTSLKIARKTMGLALDRKTDYRIGPEDVLEISIFEWELRGETRTLDVRVEESGAIVLPVVAEVDVGGMTVQQTKALLEKRLVDGGILKAPRVSVVVKEFRSKRVAVVGAVHDPGVYTLRQNATTLLAVLTLAGGPTDRAGQVLYVLRRTDASPRVVVEPDKKGEGTAAVKVTLPAPPEVISVDLFELMELGRIDLNAILQNGDIVNVPEAMKFYVVGLVEKPGGFPLTRPTTVLEGIALSGGLKERRASPRKCVLKRHVPGGGEVRPVDLVAISRGEEANFYLKPNDVIDVRQTWQRMVFLEMYDLVRGVFNVGYSLNN